MPSGLSREQVSAIAGLANLDLSLDELDLYARQLGDVLSAVADLQQIDTSNVPPTAAIVAGHAADRDDEIRPSLERAAALGGAPDAASEGFFKVPRVIG